MAVELAAGQAWAAVRLGQGNSGEGSAKMRLSLRPPDSPFPQEVLVQLEELVVGFSARKADSDHASCASPGLTSPGFIRLGEGSMFYGLDPRIARVGLPPGIAASISKPRPPSRHVPQNT